MANPETLVIRSFAGGELAPALAARADLAKYQIGLRQCRNFLVQRHGGVANRGGTRFIGQCVTDDADVVLVRYVSEIVNESVLIEFGELYFRFWFQGAAVQLSGVAAWNGATNYVIGDIVVSAAVNYYAVAANIGSAPPNANWYAMPGAFLEVPHPFVNPFQVHWVQSGRVITFTHPDHAPRDLVYVSLTRWAIITLVTKPKVGVVQALAFVAPPAAGARSFGYIVTAAAPDSFEEGEPSGQLVNAACAEPTPLAPHRLQWTTLLTPPITGAPSPEYYVYCDPFGNGTYGFIGTATAQATFNNPGFAPDFSITPPIPRPLFATTNEFPSTCGYHQQRRYFAHTRNAPDAVYASRVGFPDNYGSSSPLQDDDAVTFRIAGNNHHAVRYLVALKNLLLMTDGGEWRLTGGGGAITPNTIDLDQETYIGIASLLRPVVVGNSVIYAQARESKIHDLNFDQAVEGLAGRDLTVFASHLFDGHTIRGMDYALSPDSIVWVVRQDGVLLGLTYIREQDVWGWHRHDTVSGGFERVCVVPEPGEDAVYFIVGRNGHRYIERLVSRSIVDFNVDSFFVDSGLSYSGAPVGTVGGLAHLNGQTVRVCADGEDRGTAVVAGGSVTIPGAAASNIHVGLPITAEIETLDLDAAGTAVRDKQKRLQGANVIIDASSRGMLAGPNDTQLKRYVRSLFDPTNSAFTGQIEVNFNARWEKPGRVFIRQDQALPLTVLAVLPLVEIGG